MTPQRILVTGGAGFIGSHTVEHLLQHDIEVIVLDNLSSGKLENLPLDHPQLECIEGDVLEYPFVEELVARCDAVLHLAAIASVPFSLENPIYSFQVNTQGFLHVLEAVHQAKHPVRLVYASSAAVYGDVPTPPCHDDRPLSNAPLSPYALQKRHAEEYAALYDRLYDLKSLALRYFNVYGSRQDPHSPYSGVISRFLEGYQQQQPLTVYGDGQQSRDFIHVSDVARANWLALNSPYAGALNIATGQPETLLNVIQSIEVAGGKPATLSFKPPRAGDIRVSYASVEKAKAAIQFTAAVRLREGMKRMV